MILKTLPGTASHDGTDAGLVHAEPIGDSELRLAVALAALVFLAAPSFAQPPALRRVYSAAADAPGSCIGSQQGQVWINTTSGLRWVCDGASYVAIQYPGGGGAAWGSITGTLSAQTDLQTALDAKEPSGAFSGIGACAANQWASTLNDTAAPTCTQPAFSNLSGAATDAQIPNTITLDNLTQVTTRAISDTTGTLAMGRGGTDNTTAPDDNVLVGSGSAWVLKAVNDCQGAGKALTYTASSNTWGCNTISGGSGPVTVRLAADSALSTTTKTNLTGMSFALAANTSYSWRCNMFTTANATTVGVQFALTFGGTVTAVRGMFQGPGAATTLLWITDTTFQLDFNPTASQGNVAGMVTLSGTIEVSGTGGTLQFQHGSETATLTTVQRGSWCSLF